MVEILQAVVERRVAGLDVRIKRGASACVIAASAGYPGKSSSGKAISGLERVGPGVQVFHAGTKLVDGQIVTAGGRVLAVTAAAGDLREALGLVYAALDGIRFDGMQVRRDIGWRAPGAGAGE